MEQLYPSPDDVLENVHAGLSLNKYLALKIKWEASRSTHVENGEELQNILTNKNTSHLREQLLIESVKSAFGESRGGQKRTPSDEAWKWIISEERELPFSFNQCCLACEVDPEKMLSWLFYYKRKLLI